MALSDRLLMGPGPSNPYPEVTMALAGPVLGHLDPEFLRILDETNDRLRQIFETTNPLTLPVSGTGSSCISTSPMSTSRSTNRRSRYFSTSILDASGFIMFIVHLPTLDFG